MKKFAALVIVFTMLLSSTTFVSALSEPKTISVELSDTPTAVKPGEAVSLEAVTEKYGSSYSITWNNATEGQTVYSTETGCYISDAVFQADIPGIYTISYEIKMYAGSSETAFEGRVERTIEVVGTATLVGAEIRDLTATPVYGIDGNISYYQASGIVYSLWSDGTAKPYGSIFFNFGASTTSKNLPVTIYDNGKQYVFYVTVYR